MDFGKSEISSRVQALLSGQQACTAVEEELVKHKHQMLPRHVRSSDSMSTPVWQTDDCRACLSVEELMKKAREMKQSTSTVQADPITRQLEIVKSENQRNCPLNTDDLGRSTWSFLHTLAAYYPDRPSDVQKSNAKEIMNLIGQMYPCHHCAEDLRNDLKKNPPNVSSKTDFSLWMCDLHNRVNGKLKKSVFDCSRWRERWLDGWKNGSCDY